MGQVALGLRSLIVKLAIFFIMATLLAWALGGTLWPRAEIIDQPAVRLGDDQWSWRCLAGGGTEDMHWQLMRRDQAGEITRADDRHWDDIAGLWISEGWLYYACRAADGGQEGWRIERRQGVAEPEVYELTDRLSVEQQMARLQVGLPVQDVTLIRRQRGLVVNPPELPADGTE